MPKTVAEVLKESGLTDEQIAALDAKVITGVTQVLSTATQTLEQAELAKRAQENQFVNEIAPALDGWANKEANLTAERDYYKSLAEKAKTGGFVAEVPPFKAAEATRGADGKFVSGANPVPGSPAYVTQREAYQMVASTNWAVTEYMRLHSGQVPPDDLETLNAEAVAQHMPFRAYVEKKYDFSAKREKIKADEQKKHDDAIRLEATEKVNKEWAEKVGNNPNVRIAETSRFSTLEKAVKSGERGDPLKMTPEQRHSATRQAIQKEIAANETVQ